MSRNPENLVSSTACLSTQHHKDVPPMSNLDLRYYLVGSIGDEISKGNDVDSSPAAVLLYSFAEWHGDEFCVVSQWWWT